MKGKAKRTSRRQNQKHGRHDYNPYDGAFARCSLCGQLGAIYYHYLEKDEDGQTRRAAHPVVPLLCEKCAWQSGNHGSQICAVWYESFCVISETQLLTNTILPMPVHT
jgi:hypothetical protein